MKISVVIPTYNRPERTKRAIESALAQTRVPAEVIVVDDASYPPFEFMSTSEHSHIVRVIRLDPNRGAAGARQAGVDAAAGTHIAFLDSDDTWMADKLEQQATAAQDMSDADRVVVCCAWNVVDTAIGDVIETRIPIPSNRLIDFCSGCWCAPGSTALLPRQLLQEVAGFDTELRRLEDLDLLIKVGAAGGRLAVVPHVGARIERGQNARVEDITPAVERIADRYLRSDSPLGRAEQRRLRAWLDVELAAGFYYARRWHRVAFYLCRSWIRAPRLRLQLGRWWE